MKFQEATREQLRAKTTEVVCPSCGWSEFVIECPVRATMAVEWDRGVWFVNEVLDTDDPEPKYLQCRKCKERHCSWDLDVKVDQ